MFRRGKLIIIERSPIRCTRRPSPVPPTPRCGARCARPSAVAACRRQNKQGVAVAFETGGSSIDSTTHSSLGPQQSLPVDTKQTGCYRCVRDGR